MAKFLFNRSPDDSRSNYRSFALFVDVAEQQPKPSLKTLHNRAVGLRAHQLTFSAALSKISSTAQLGRDLAIETNRDGHFHRALCPDRA
jgi:hypothetical protein